MVKKKAIKLLNLIGAINMRNQILGLLTVTLLTVSFNVSAFALQSYKSNKTSKASYTAASFERIFNANSPVCIKSKSKILGVNTAFKKNNLAYGDCSNGEAASFEHRAKGIKVTVIKLHTLPMAVASEVIKQSNNG